MIPSPLRRGTRRPGAFHNEEGSLDRTDGLPPTRERTRPPPDPGPRPTTGSSRHRASARKGRPRARRFGARPSAASHSRATASAPRNRLGGPGPQLTSVDWDVSAPPRFGKAGTRTGPRARPNNGTVSAPAALRHRRRSNQPSGRTEKRHTVSAPAALRHRRRSSQPSGRMEKRRTPHRVAQTPSGARTAHGGASADATTELRPRRSRRRATATTTELRLRPRCRGPDRTASAEQPGGSSRREEITPAMHALALLRKDDARRQNGPDGACPRQPAAPPGANVSPNPLGGEDAPRQPAAPPLLGEATPPAAHPGPATALPRKSIGGPSQARPTNPPRGRGEPDHGADRPTPLGGAVGRTRTGFGGIGAKRGTRRSSEHHGRQVRHHGADRGPSGALRSTTVATERTRRRPRPQRRSSEHHRNQRTHQVAPRSTTATERNPGPTPAPARQPPRGPTSRQRHASARTATPSGATRKAPAPRRALRSPTQPPNAPDQRNAP